MKDERVILVFMMIEATGATVLWDVCDRLDTALDAVRLRYPHLVYVSEHVWKAGGARFTFEPHTVLSREKIPHPSLLDKLRC